MSAPLFSNSLPETLLELTQLAKPTSYADIAALGLVAIGSAGYLLRGIAWDKPDPYNHLWYERPQQKDGAGINGQKETRNIAQKLEESDKSLVIFWGSQSGTAEGFANRLARECHLRFGLNCMAADLSDYDADTIALIPQTKLAIFIMSTFGEGDPSDNSAGLWDLVLKSTDTKLQNLRYMAFGLGNSNYKYYNRVIDVVTEALDKFGAEKLMPVGRADDATGATEEDFMGWKDELFTVFRNDLKYEEHEIAYEPTLAVIEDESLEPIDLHHGEPVHPKENAKSAAACSPIKALNIQSTRELFTSSTRNCIHMDLDLNDQQELHYKTGDHLAVWPTNPDDEVERLLRVLDLSERRDVPISVQSLDETVKVKVPTPTTLSALFRYYVEICVPISRDTITNLAQFAPNSEIKAFLTTLSSSKSAYAEFLTHTHLTLGRLLETAVATTPSSPQTWPTLPLSWILESLPHTQPRYYSISSSSAISPRTPSITALVASTPLAANPSVIVNGVTSNYLLALSQHHTSSDSVTPPKPSPYTLTNPALAVSGPESSKGHKIHAHIRKSKFKLPISSMTPLIMVAAGTGLAPFRAFVAERARLATVGKEIGPMVLFFGCRDPAEDYIYREELEDYVKQLNGKLKIVTAFSRVGDGKVYVQDRVKEDEEEVCRLMLDEAANFYICGRASMAREVGRVVTAAVGKRKGWEEAEVKIWSEGVKRRGKWGEDVWG